MKGALLDILGVYLYVHCWLYLYEKLIEIKFLGQMVLFTNMHAKDSNSLHF